MFKAGCIICFKQQTLFYIFNQPVINFCFQSGLLYSFFYILGSQKFSGPLFWTRLPNDVYLELQLRKFFFRVFLYSFSI